MSSYPTPPQPKLALGTSQTPSSCRYNLHITWLKGWPRVSVRPGLHNTRDAAACSHYQGCVLPVQTRERFANTHRVLETSAVLEG